MDPIPVAVDELLPEPLYARELICRDCRTALLYQRQERPRYPRHFFWCRRCGRRYAAWETGWTPPGMGVTVRVAPPEEPGKPEEPLEDGTS